MCIRDSFPGLEGPFFPRHGRPEDGVKLVGELKQAGLRMICLLYTSDAADDLLCVDLGGRRIIKKKKPRISTWPLPIIII